MAPFQLPRIVPEPLLPRAGAPAAALPGADANDVNEVVVWPRRILVASDGSFPARAGIAAARALAERSRATVEIAAVYSPRIPMPASELRRGFEQCEGSDRIDAAALLRAVRGQLREHGLDWRRWALRRDVGEPSSVLIRLAEQTDADLVVLGIGRREPTDRRYGGRTALRAARYLRVALLAASPECETPVRGVVVWPDGRVHVPTLCAALACMAPVARLWIVVPDRGTKESASAAEASIRDMIIEHCGAPVAERLATIGVQRMAVSGDLLAAVLRVADEVGAQLVAVPNRGDPGPVRAFLPNLADPLLLTARCSVLVVPDAPAA